MQPQPLPGFRDFYPADFAFRAHIFETWRAVAARYGFEEWDGPPLEPLELYTAKSGEEIVGQLYSFTDKGGREVALRPELTPTVARMVAARAAGMKKPIRWFSIGQMFRYERQQRGRLREFFQLNCDLFGESGALADAEVIALSLDLLRAFGLGPSDVRVRLSHRRLLRRLLEAIGTWPQHIEPIFKFVDRMDRKGAIDEVTAHGEPWAPTTVQEVVEIASLTDWFEIQRRALVAKSGERVVEEFSGVLAGLESMGLREFVDIDLKIVRGLDYYTGTVFELFDAQRSLRAIAGGGRYDGLLSQLGGVDLPAVGFAVGDVVLGELLRERGKVPPVQPPIDVFVAAVTGDDLPHVLRLAHDLRDAGVRVEYALKIEAIGKQLKLADARDAAFAVVIGPDDRARGEVQLKDLRGTAQRAVKAVELVPEVKRSLAGAGR